MIPLLGVAFGLGLLAGFIARGSVANLSSIKIVWTPVIIGALAVGMVPFFVDLDDAPRRALQLASHGGILAFLLANLETARGAIRTGFAFLTAGWFLNFICIALNGGMPLSRWAWGIAGDGAPITPGKGGFFKGTIADADTKLRPLGDVIPIEPIGQVISIGDILILAGIAIVIAAGMRRARAPQPATEA